MGTTENTRINFNLLELIHLIGRLEVQQDISYCNLSMDGNKMPHTRKTKTKIHQLPTDKEICDIIAKAKGEAVEIALSFNMILDDFEVINEFEFQSKLDIDETLEELADNFFDDSDDEASEVGDDAQIDDVDQEALSDNEPDFEHSRFTEIVDANGDCKIVLKSSLVWSYLEPGVKMSNDRTNRFKCRAKRRKIS